MLNLSGRYHSNGGTTLVMARTVTKVACITAFLCACIVWWAFSPRLSALLLFGLLLLALLSVRWHRRWPLVAVVLGLFLIAPLLPIDIAFDRSSGRGPRIMSITYGYLSPEAKELAKKGLIWSGGCVLFPNSPKWVLVL